MHADRGETQPPKYNISDCEGLSDLLARIRSNGVRVMLVERATRLVRDLIVGELIAHHVVCGIFRASGMASMQVRGGFGDRPLL